MSTLSALALMGTAHAAALDQLEVGGLWGTPTADDATAIWWNPAGLAAGEGTRLQLEGAPIFATMSYDRSDPLNGGLDVYKQTAVLPFAGVASDLGVDGLGLGAGVVVPLARGANEVDEPGTGAYGMRQGLVQAVFLMAGGGYEIADRVALGAAVAKVQSGWDSSLNTETMTALYDSLVEAGSEPTYTDDQVEDPDYMAVSQFGEGSDGSTGGLKGSALTWSAGARVKVNDRVAVSLAYVRGFDVSNSGPVTLDFGCPPQDDIGGRFIWESRGLCDATIYADSTVSYTLPSRIQGGVRLDLGPEAATRLDLMGGYVQWSAFRDYSIEISGIEENNTFNENIDPSEVAEKLEQVRLLARDSRDSFWAGADVKHHLGEDWLIGGRLLFDKAAVPTQSLQTNNYDADTLQLGGLVAFSPVEFLTLSLSLTHFISAPRTVEDGNLGITLDQASRNEDRYFYPHMNGTYSGTIDRLGLALRSEF